MQRFVLIVVSSLVINLLVGEVWAHSPQAPAGQRHRLLPPVLNLIQDVEGEQTHVYLEIDPLALNTPVNFEPLPQVIAFDSAFRARGEHSLPSLLSKQEWRGFWQLSANADPSHVTLSSEGELVSTPLENTTHSGNVESWYFLVRLVHDRTWEKSTYGAEYARIEPDFPYQTGSEFSSDQEGLKLWGHWRFGVTKLHMSLRQFRNNVYQEPSQTRMRTSEGKMALDIVLPSWPHLNVSYTNRLSESTFTPEWAAPIKRSHETASVTLSYDREAWATTLTSVYAESNDHLHPDTQEQTVYYTLAISYALTRAIKVAPTLSFHEKSSQPSQARLTTPSASLSLTYHRLFHMVDVNAQGSYERGEDNQGAVDYWKIATSISLVWNLTTFLQENVSLTLKADYASYVDAITPTSSYEEVSGGIFLKIAPS